MKGKKTPPELTYKIMLSYAVTHNYSETGRLLNVPEATVRKIIDDNKDNEDFQKLCNEKRDEFVNKANTIIDKALNRLEQELDSDDKIPVNNLSTVIGTLYDKRALAKGNPTSNETVTIKVEITDE